MKKPSVASYLLGNHLSAVVIFLVGGTLIFEWWRGQYHNNAVPVIAFLAIVAAANAHQKVSKYSNWKRAWDAMGAPSTATRSISIRPLLGVAFWLVVAGCLAGLNYHRPESTPIAIGVGVLFLVTIIWAGFRHRHPAGVRRRKDIPVSIAVEVPRAAPKIRDFVRKLPAYCRQVF
jgi:hypothetical protein